MTIYLSDHPCTKNTLQTGEDICWFYHNYPGISYNQGRIDEIFDESSTTKEESVQNKALISIIVLSSVWHSTCQFMTSQS